MHQQRATTSFLIEILPGEVFLRIRDSCKFKLHGGADRLKETSLEVTGMVRLENRPAGVLASLRELAVIGNVAARKAHPSLWLTPMFLAVHKGTSHALCWKRAANRRDLGPGLSPRHVI